ncbi:TIGR03619 family F420-dependent LLM class oxidoreductase [Streptosporangium sp. NPDC004379]|uniref:TIGR03619 family F420-dependent LLM class oxidoreductase n=1 Tax=Streptosporangium sp. NPDC004379 TaxID=3366189 RepID=UPI0036A9B701
MAVGFGLAVPQYGRFARPEAVVAVAREAEARGFDGLWAGDRLLTPLSPRDRYPGGDGTIPPEHRTFLDPLAVLTTAAAVTSRIRLGTSTLNANWYPPVLLARSLTTLDVLSGGRLDAGLGLGWSRDEYAAAGVPWKGRAAWLDATIDTLEAVWRDDPVAVTAPGWSIPPSHIDPKPVQRPRPPLLLAGFSPAALERVGRRADGWLAAAMPVPLLTGMRDAIRRAAERAGRDPDGIRVVVRANPVVTGTAGATVEEVGGRLRAIAETGVQEIFVDLQLTARDPAHLLDLAETLRETVLR